MSDWQPIETAPKDGRHILVNDPFQLPRVVAAKWVEGEGYALFVYADEVLQDICAEGPQCTHWMPLPEPPK